jgi:hypothetical protein
MQARSGSQAAAVFMQAELQILSSVVLLTCTNVDAK